MTEYPYILKRGIYYPIIPLKLKHRNLDLTTDALIDSGANVSVFQSSIADYFGINIFEGERISLQGIGGRILAYIHTIDFEVGDHSFSSRIAFSREMIHHINILGRDDFFSHFIITFDEIARKVILHKQAEV